MAKKDIVICDDDEGILEVSSIILQDLGYMVHIFTDATHILEEVQKIKPGLVLLDLWMPTGSGEEIARAIKGNPETSNAAVVIVSANINTEKIAKTAGADEALCKPFDISELEQIAKKYLG